MESENVTDYPWKVHRSLLRRDLVPGVSRPCHHYRTHRLYGLWGAAILVCGGYGDLVCGSAGFDQV